MYSKLVNSVCVAAALCMSHVAFAGTINGGELLNQSGATFLEARLGLGDLDFTNISNLSVGASASTWHSNVAGYKNVISIYDVSFQGNNYLIGGYSTIGHDGNNWSYNPAATSNNFLFNISLGIVHNTQNLAWNGQLDQYDHSSYFATFGGGHDLFGGYTTLGVGGSSAYVYGQSYYGNGYSYGGGANLLGAGINGLNWITINGLESFVFQSAAPSANVPEPSGLVLFGLGLVGLGFARKRKIV